MQPVHGRLAAALAAAGVGIFVVVARLLRLERRLAAYAAQLGRLEARTSTSGVWAPRKAHSAEARSFPPDSAAPPPPEVVSDAPELTNGAIDPVSTSPFSRLPEEGLARVLEALPPSSQLVCERVCHEWRNAVASQLPTWPRWCAAPAALSETALSIPGVMTAAFGASLSPVPADLDAAAATAAAQAAELPADRLQIATCGSQWTVLAMESAATPRALAQHCAHDYLLSACGEHVASGDKDGQLRLWCARSGRLLARLAVGGASLCALELAACGYAVLGDSSGMIKLVQVDAMLRGEVRGVSFRAHEGKTTCTSSRGVAPSIVSGGTDGAVRRWDLRALLRTACHQQAPPTQPLSQPPSSQPPSSQPPSSRPPSSQPTSSQLPQPPSGDAMPADARSTPSPAPSTASAVAPAGGSSRLVDLGLWPIADGGVGSAVCRHADSVTCVGTDGVHAASSSRDGTVMVADLGTGARLLTLPGCGQVACFGLHRAKLIICADDGQAATIQLWDLRRCERVQQLGGIRKWSAPTSIAYFGYDRALWLRDTNLSTLTWPETRPEAAE